MEKELNISKTFPAITKEAWKEKVIKDLKGADFDRKLVWKTYDGFQIQPFYTADDLPENKSFGSSENETRDWVNYAEIFVIDENKANEQAKYLIQFDTTGFVFAFGDNQTIDFSKLLHGIDPTAFTIGLKTHKPSAKLIESYFRYCEDQSITLDNLNGFYESDVLEEWISGGDEPKFDEVANVVNVASKASNFYGLSIQSHAFLNSGSSTTQEAGFLFNKVVEYIAQLGELGIAAEEVIDNIHLHTATSADFFFEVAKIRAIKNLSTQVFEQYGVAGKKVKVLSSSSLWSKSLFDPNVNMLRNTTEGMAAVLGGCDGLLIQPHDSSYETPTNFSHRIALNISNLLKEESYFDKVHDASAGSYYIETLTEKIAETTLAIFQEVEEKGGFIVAFESGKIAADIQAVREQKEKDLASRKQVVVGTNKYPNLDESISKDTLTDQANGNGLKAQRSSQTFDAMRLKTIQHFEATGFIPKVYLSCFGNLAMRKARATFSSEFFGTAGFKLLGEFAFPTALEAAENAATSEADIVVICASDPDYEADAESFAKLIKEKASDKLLILAGYPKEILDKLKEAGVYEFIHMKTNAIETLGNIQNQLFETTKQ